MNLKENNKTDKNTVELVVEVKGDEFKAAVDAAFKKNIKKMTVPGFRKGKAPRKMVEKLYGEGVFYDDAINALYPAAYDAAVSRRVSLPWTTLLSRLRRLTPRALNLRQRLP